MNNSEIEILIKKHEARIKILNEIKSVNKDIEIYFYLTSGIKKDSFPGLKEKWESKITELNCQKTKLLNKYKLI